MKSASNEQGAAAVEFALVFVFLVTMLLLIVEGGIVFMQQASVSASAREGARMMAITNDRTQAQAAAAAAYPFGTLDSVSIPTECPDPPDRSVTVTVTVAEQPFGLGFLGVASLTGVGAMRCGG